ncbi:YoaP domain-containing protein [Virgibacillus sp. NKC19-3]|uniref:GNAT family N-acetyltransferase n=1 Tax=Virgibacillus saliphilus TaxID=2831674 RepID=UPI001C9B7F15|nr:GNAT family N-acetyltransferase [Virgibacillus sp. NKC19-3]MBY7142473.1 YoaP domain-containing protein [Virgibacillus sp. NKC19-3]
MENNEKYTILEVGKDNIDRYGFFCMRSKKGTTGYTNKYNWIVDRFNENIRLKILTIGERQIGFIEYIPIEYAWRGVKGNNYLFIHCLWIVGQGKGHGYGKILLDECINDAMKFNKSGVAILASEGSFIADKPFFLSQGFSLVESRENFDLLVKKIDDSSLVPKLTDLNETYSIGNENFVIFKSDQCPYIENTVQIVKETADELGVNCEIVDLKTAEEAQKNPSLYGVFSIYFRGEIISYHPITKKELLKRLNSYI